MKAALIISSVALPVATQHLTQVLTHSAEFGVAAGLVALLAEYAVWVWIAPAE